MTKMLSAKTLRRGWSAHAAWLMVAVVLGLLGYLSAHSKGEVVMVEDDGGNFHINTSEPSTERVFVNGVDVGMLMDQLKRYLKTCPAGKFVSENQCSDCPDGFYSSGDNLDAECKPCVCPHGQYVKHCPKDSMPECVDSPIIVHGWDQCGTNEWKIEGPHTITNEDNNRCWTSTENHSTRVGSGDIAGQDAFELKARSSVSFVAGSYDFFCTADDFCSISVKKIGTDNWQAIIPYPTAQTFSSCCRSYHARATLETADYEVEYNATDLAGGFHFTSYIVPT